MTKKAFTIVEVLLACTIFTVILSCGISVIAMMTRTLYDGQTESENRSNLSELTYYLSREIQSAKDIEISDGGKILKIEEQGHEGYNLVYSFVKSHPTDYLAFKSKKLIDVKYEGSFFDFEDGCVVVRIAALKNSTGENQIPKTVSIKCAPRSLCDIAKEEED